VEELLDLRGQRGRCRHGSAPSGRSRRVDDSAGILPWRSRSGRVTTPRQGTPGARKPRRRGLGLLGRRNGTPHSPARAMPSAVSVAVVVRLLTRMPNSASSIAADRVKLRRPLLPVQYPMFHGSPWCPAHLVGRVVVDLPREEILDARRESRSARAPVPSRRRRNRTSARASTSGRSAGSAVRRKGIPR